MSAPSAWRAALVLAALALAADESTTDALKSLKGTWVSDEGIDSTWTFDGESLKATVNGMDYNCKVKVDPKAKPATIDLAIDEGPIVVMIENYRSGLLWKLFMSCPEIQNGLKKLGFTSPWIKN